MSESKRPNLFVYAKGIRHEGEPWNDAIARAKGLLDQQYSQKFTKIKRSQCAGLSLNDCKDECYWVKESKPTGKKGKSRKAHCAIKPLFRFPEQMPELKGLPHRPTVPAPRPRSRPVPKTR